MTPAKNGGKNKKGFSAINELVTRKCYYHSQVHPWNELQEAHPLGTQRDTKIGHEGDGNFMCALIPGLTKLSGPKE